MKGVLVIAALVAVSAGAPSNSCSKGVTTTLLPDFKDCAGFWKCADGVLLFQSCPEGQHFSARLQRCTLPVFARCQAEDGDAPKHSALASGFLDALRNVISRKAQPVSLVEDELSAPPELPIDHLADEEDMVRRFPDVEADEADGDTEADSGKEKKKSPVEEVEGELNMEEEMEQEEPADDEKEQEQDEIEQPGDKIEEEEDEVEEEPEEKMNETSDVEEVIPENDGEKRQDSKEDAAVVKEEDEEEEEDENKKKSKDKSANKESKKNKSEEKEEDSGSDVESEDEDWLS